MASRKSVRPKKRRVQVDLPLSDGEGEQVPGQKADKGARESQSLEQLILGLSEQLNPLRPTPSLLKSVCGMFQPL